MIYIYIYLFTYRQIYDIYIYIYTYWYIKTHTHYIYIFIERERRVYNSISLTQLPPGRSVRRLAPPASSRMATAVSRCCTRDPQWPVEPSAWAEREGWPMVTRNGAIKHGLIYLWKVVISWVLPCFTYENMPISWILPMNICDLMGWMGPPRNGWFNRKILPCLILSEGTDGIFMACGAMEYLVGYIGILNIGQMYEQIWTKCQSKGGLIPTAGLGYRISILKKIQLVPTGTRCLSQT